MELLYSFPYASCLLSVDVWNKVHKKMLCPYPLTIPLLVTIKAYIHSFIHSGMHDIISFTVC